MRDRLSKLEFHAGQLHAAQGKGRPLLPVFASLLSGKNKGAGVADALNLQARAAGSDGADVIREHAAPTVCRGHGVHQRLEPGHGGHFVSGWDPSSSGEEPLCHTTLIQVTLRPAPECGLAVVAIQLK